MQGMDRRTLLASIGSATVAGLAGCSSAGEDATPTPEPTATATATATPEASPTPSPEPTPTATPTPDAADRDLGEASSIIETSLSAYGAVRGDGQPITAPLAEDAVDEQDVGAIRGGLHDARSLLDGLDDADLSDDQAARRDALITAQWLAWWMPEVHQSLSNSRERALATWDRIAGDWSSQDLRVEEIRERANAARQTLNRLHEDVPEDYLGPTDLLSKADFEERVALFDREIGHCHAMADVCATIPAAGTRYQDAMDTWGTHDDNWGEESTAFYGVQQRVGDVRDELDGEDWTQSFVDWPDDVRCYLDAWDERASVLERAADAGASGNREKAEQIEAEEDPGPSEC